MFHYFSFYGILFIVRIGDDYDDKRKFRKN